LLAVTTASFNAAWCGAWRRGGSQSTKGTAGWRLRITLPR
jgi:hypothetical protein